MNTATAVYYVLGATLPIVAVIALIVWAGGIWRDLPLLKRFDRSRSERRWF